MTKPRSRERVASNLSGRLTSGQIQLRRVGCDGWDLRASGGLKLKYRSSKGSVFDVELFQGCKY